MQQECGGKKGGVQGLGETVNGRWSAVRGKRRALGAGRCEQRELGGGGSASRGYQAAEGR